MKKSILLFLLFTNAFSAAVFCQKSDWKTEKQVGAVFGLTQPVFVSGFNIEAVYIHNRFIFDYSHGVSLTFEGDALTDELRDQELTVHMPFTTGFGVGYRFAEWLNLRVEPKWHRFNFHYEGGARSGDTRIASDDTFSLGLGLYGLIQPWKRKENALRGVTIAPSIRYWPTLSSGISSDGLSYQNSRTGRSETLHTLDPGFGFTPLIFNVSIGYMFGLKGRIN